MRQRTMLTLHHLGLRGFDDDWNNAYRVKFDGSVGIFLNDHLLIRAKYRGKPNKLSVFREDAFKNVYVAWLLYKHLATTGAYAMLGNIDGKPDENAIYISTVSNKAKQTLHIVNSRCKAHDQNK